MASTSVKMEYNFDALEPYILGKKFTSPKQEFYRCYDKDLENFLTMLEEDDIAKSFFETFELPKNFYDTMVDFKHFFPSEKRVELFYAAKCGRMYKEIPSICVYMLDKAWKEANGIPNLILKYLPTQAIKNFFQKDYFLGGLTLQDVIRSLYCAEYSPLSTYHPKNKVGDFTEIYVRSEDMVAAVPNRIADCLDDNSVLQITLDANGLKVNDIYLRSMAGYVGSINSHYDLRELL